MHGITIESDMDSDTLDHKHDYHSHVPDKDWYRFPGIDISDPYRYSRTIVNSPQFLPLWNSWKEKLHLPFYGVTNDGVKREGLYRLQDEGAPVRQAVSAANDLLKSLDQDEKKALFRDLDGIDWRKWSNPEFVLYKSGLRLEHIDRKKVDLILDLMKQSLSTSGFEKVRAAMKTNRFLGEICSRQAILNEYSYSFTLFGVPSETQPWSYLFFGHHVALHVHFIGQQMVIGPVFLGAEPCIIDQGPDKGTELCATEADLGLELMRSLSPELRKKAQIYPTMKDPTMPNGRWHPADERHLAGAFQDNRVIAYEGVLASDMAEEEQAKLLSLTAAFLVLLPPKPLEFRLNHIRIHLSETYFSWIGGYGPSDPFYFRIQSPVVLLEFDHHCGVFLTNTTPAKYHIHTIQRLPNGNDYGRALIELFRNKE